MTLPLIAQYVVFGVLFLSLAFAMYRLLHGPHLLDRIMAVDAVALIAACLMAVFEIVVGTDHFFDAVLVLTIVGFFSTVALSRYVQEGSIVE